MKKVLCIDDSQLIRKSLADLLAKTGLSVLEAENGRVGLEVLARNPDVSLIFCDINMPEMNGVAFCESYFANVEYRKIPVFILTTEGELSLKDELKKFGVKGWVMKPFSEAKISIILKHIFPVGRVVIK